MEETIQRQEPHTDQRRHHLLVTGAARLAMWQKLRGLWHEPHPNPADELARLRDAWDRPVPPLH